jgi:hypothetical protein
MHKYDPLLMFLITILLHVFVQFITDSVVASIGIDGQGGMRLTFGTKARGIRIRTKKGNKVCNYPVKSGGTLPGPGPCPYPAARPQRYPRGEILPTTIPLDIQLSVEQFKKQLHSFI